MSAAACPGRAYRHPLPADGAAAGCPRLPRSPRVAAASTAASAPTAYGGSDGPRSLPAPAGVYGPSPSATSHCRHPLPPQLAGAARRPGHSAFRQRHHLSTPRLATAAARWRRHRLRSPVRCRRPPLRPTGARSPSPPPAAVTSGSRRRQVRSRLVGAVTGLRSRPCSAALAIATARRRRRPPRPPAVAAAYHCYRAQLPLASITTRRGRIFTSPQLAGTSNSRPCLPPRL